MSTFLVYKVKKCLLKSGKVMEAIVRVLLSVCPILPKALGILARNKRLKVLVLSGISTRACGHKHLCFRALFQKVIYVLSTYSYPSSLRQSNACIPIGYFIIFFFLIFECKANHFFRNCKEKQVEKED